MIHRSHPLRALSTVALLALAAGACSNTDRNTDAASSAPDAGTVDRGFVDGAPAPDARPDVALPEADAAPIQLPADEAPHDDPVEWWYYTGELLTADNARYGFELVTFQALFAGVRMFRGHFAITDPAQQRFDLATKTKAGELPQPQQGFSFTLDDWHMAGHDGSDELRAAMPDGSYAIDLKLSATKPVVFQYGTGMMTIGSPDPFYYYSYTDMDVSGTLTVAGAPLAVTGTAWMDHQWGDMGSNFDGWDWYSLRLDDNTEVMIFVVRRQSGDFTGGTVIAADGSYAALKTGDFSIEPTGEWTSTRTGATYPQGWKIAIPSRDLQVTVSPVLADQEFYETVYHEPVYWEGLCDVEGFRASKALGGHAYVELTGYAPPGAP